MTTDEDDHLDRLSRRVERMEQEVGNHGRLLAVLQERLSTVAGNQEKMISGINRMIWVLVTGFAGVLLNFVFSGGLIQ